MKREEAETKETKRRGIRIRIRQYEKEFSFCLLCLLRLLSFIGRPFLLSLALLPSYSCTNIFSSLSTVSFSLSLSLSSLLLETRTRRTRTSGNSTSTLRIFSLSLCRSHFAHFLLVLHQCQKKSCKLWLVLGTRTAIYTHAQSNDYVPLLCTVAHTLVTISIFKWRTVEFRTQPAVYRGCTVRAAALAARVAEHEHEQEQPKRERTRGFEVQAKREGKVYALSSSVLFCFLLLHYSSSVRFVSFVSSPLHQSQLQLQRQCQPS